GGLAAARTPDEGDHLAGLDVDVDVAQDILLAGRVAEIDIADVNAAFGAVDGTCAVVFLAWHVEQIEDGTGSSHAGLDGVADPGQALERPHHAHHGAEEGGDVAR